MDELVQFVVAAFVPCALLFALLWLARRAIERWAANRENAVVAARAGGTRGRKIDAEILEDDPPRVPSPTDRRCRACGGHDSSSWHRPSTIGEVAGLVGWSRRVRGLPPLYTRTRPPFGREDLCADCSHVRDRRIDTRIHEANLAIFRVSEDNALENQKFLAGLDDSMRADVVPANRRLRSSSIVVG